MPSRSSSVRMAPLLPPSVSSTPRVLLFDEFHTKACADDAPVVVCIFAANGWLEYEMYRAQEDERCILLVVLLVVFKFVVADEQLSLIRSLD